VSAVGFYKITKLVLKSMLKKPATHMYPDVPKEWHERTRGQIRIEEAGCILCNICAKKCPADAIKVSRDEKTWVIERMRCVQCESCVEACPKKCLIMEQQYTAPAATKTVDSVAVPEQPKPDAKAAE